MINTQIWRPNTCDCAIMQKVDTDFPDKTEYITAEEYLKIIQGKQGEKNVIDMETAQKQADRIKICDIHKSNGHTKKLFEEVKKYNLENKIEIDG